MRRALLVWLLVFTAARAEAQVISCGLASEPVAPDLVVRGTVVGEQVRRVEARGVAFHVVRAALEVDELLWGDADRPAPRIVDLHDSRRVDEGPPRSWRGTHGVWSLWRTDAANTFTVSEVAAAFVHPRPAPRGRLRSGRITRDELSVELRLENPGPAPVSFPLKESGVVLSLDIAGDQTYGATWCHLPGGPIVVPPGRYRTRVLQERDARHSGRRGARARVTFAFGLGIHRKDAWRERVVLGPDAPVELEEARLEGGWFSRRRWSGGPTWLDPDDPALQPAPARPRRPRDALVPAIAAFGALLWAFRRRKSLQSGEGGR